jgi:hypothetical protein
LELLEATLHKIGQLQPSCGTTLIIIQSDAEFNLKTRVFLLHEKTSGFADCRSLNGKADGFTFGRA